MKKADKSLPIFRIAPEPPVPEELHNPRFLIELIDLMGDHKDYLSALENPEYLYWDKARYRPVPDKLTPELLWFIEKIRRKATLGGYESPIRDTTGRPFRWIMLDRFHATLHEIDLNFGGNLRIEQHERDRNPRYFVNRGIRDEAIASSQLEGASTTRAYAKKMLRENTAPRNRDDRMIFNNHVTMVDIEERLAKLPLSLSELIGMQVRLTNGTLDDSEQVGRLRTDSDNIVVQDRHTGAIYHQPPTRIQLEEELTRLLAFANDELKDKNYMHPVVKATLLHFWIGYLHPFPDGNGRVARAIFYWYLLRHEYWAISYLSISSFIRKSPVQYRDAYLYSEQDDNDLTYFIDYGLRKIGLAINEFRAFEARVRRLNRSIVEWGRETEGWNQRQLDLVRFFGQKESAKTTTRAHADMHGVTWMTAALDFKDLVGSGYVIQIKEGRSRPYVATEKLRQLWLRLQATQRGRTKGV